MRTIDVMLALVRYEILGADLPKGLSNVLTTEKLASLYKLSARHDIAHLVGDALFKTGLAFGEGDGERRFIKARELAIYRYTQMQHEYKRVVSQLEADAIPFIPLKGAVVRQHYPKPWMRTSCDIDILVKREDLERAKASLIGALGYQYKGEFTTHDVSLASPSGVYIELHYDLLDDDDEHGREVLSCIWDHTLLAEGAQYHSLMTDEMFYFYHVAHMARHFQHGGCGIRTVLDLWLLNNRVEFDSAKRRELMRQGGLLDFCTAMERLSEVWFGDGSYDEMLSELEEYVLRGGVYGNVDNRVRVQSAKAGGRFKYLLSRIFISSKELKKKYPILEGRPYLVPIYHLVRWFKPLFNSGSKNRAVRDAKIVKDSNVDCEKLKGMLNKLGL